MIDLSTMELTFLVALNTTGWGLMAYFAVKSWGLADELFFCNMNLENEKLMYMKMRRGCEAHLKQNNKMRVAARRLGMHWDNDANKFKHFRGPKGKFISMKGGDA